MTQNDFKKALAAFDEGESMRAQLYHRALRLIEAGFRTDAHLLILATWNFARFRYVTTTFNLAEYEKTLNRLTKLLGPVSACDLMDTDLRKHKMLIIRAFDQLARI